MTHTQEKQQLLTGTVFERVQKLDLANKDFKAAVINMLKELKKNKQVFKLKYDTQ